MIGKEIRDILLNDSDLSNLVGTSVYSDLAPQTAINIPSIVYRISFRTRQHTQDLAGVDTYRVQFFLYADTYAEVQDLEDKLDAALDRYPIGTVINAYIMDGVMQDSSSDNPYDIDENGVREKQAEYIIRVKEYTVTNYTLTEVDTGYTWVNSKAIYKRTFNLGSGPNALIDFGLAVSAVETVVKYEASIYDAEVAGEKWTIDGTLNANNTNFEFANLNTNETGYLTLWYTKP